MQLPGVKNAEEPVTAQAEVEVRIRGLMMDPNTRQPIVVLNDLTGEVVLPIWVGLFEANAIAMEIEKASVTRPMTHDLLQSSIRALNASVTRIVVGSLEEDTFHATIWMNQSGEHVAVDARPSDAIALALRSDAPIFLSHNVYEHARRTTKNANSISPDDLRRWLESLNDDDMGKYKM